MFTLLHTYLPHPILITIGPISIHWYGLLLAAGILLGYALALRLGKRQGMDADKISSIFIALVIWGFVGARLYHVLSDLSFYLQAPGEIIKVWRGGLAIHGALIAGAAALYYYARRYKISFLALADWLSPSLILGQAIGRWGNYFNQELFGRPTDLPWGIPVALGGRPPDFINYNYFHPAFLYESLWDFLVLIILLLVLKKKARGGLVFYLYLGLYAVGRAGVELLRVNSAAMIFGLRLPFAVSVVLAAGAAAALLAKPGAQLPRPGSRGN